MGYAETVSTIALLVSIAGFGNSFYSTWRDKAKLKFIVTYYPESEYGSNRIVVRAVNAGRRPIVLRLAGGLSDDGRWGGTYLDHDKGGVRLAEHEHREETFEKDDLLSFDHETEEVIEYSTLWFEDSLGNRHEVPGSRELIKKVWS